MNIGLNFSLLESLYQEIVLIFPKVVGGIVFLILSYILLKLILLLTKYILRLSKIDKLKNALNNNEALKTLQLK
ncbi:mechanosensitive ion channel family protein [Empedobacter stercoris]|uniref:mechanosensitive ion channel family protein n=1 Tax=Empedobacter stercoris TaxID=1628248 RepID=UPI003743DD5D